MNAFAMCFKRENGHWVRAGGWVRSTREAAEAKAAEWAREDPTNRVFDVVVKP